MPAKFKDRAPHVIERDGREMWVWDGGAEMTMGLNAVAGKPREQWGLEPARFDDMIPGCYDPKERAKDLLSNGIFASVAFPTLPGFAGRKFETFADKELAVACVQAWNDFVIDEWCATAPEVLVPMTIAPVWDVDLAVAETDALPGTRAPKHCVGWRTRPTSGYPAITTTTGSRCSRSARRPSCPSACTSAGRFRR